MISKEKEFIFIHNYKTGGTSIEKKLGHFKTLRRDVQDHRTIKDIKQLTERGYYFRKSLYALKKGKPICALNNFKTSLFPILTRKEYNSYYKFTFVRNTWARMYSWYVNVMNDEIHRNDYRIKEVNYSFKDFLNKKIDHESFSQLYFITDNNGNIPMDYIGRFEHLQNDFNKVCEQINIDDSELPKLLVRKYGHYTENYNSETKDLVYKFYKDEINYFGFVFGE